MLTKRSPGRGIWTWKNMLLFVFAAVFSLGLKCDSLLYILSVLIKQFHNPEYSADTRTYCTVKRRKKLKIFLPHSKFYPEMVMKIFVQHSKWHCALTHNSGIFNKLEHRTTVGNRGFSVEQLFDKSFLFDFSMVRNGCTNPGWQKLITLIPQNVIPQPWGDDLIMNPNVLCKFCNRLPLAWLIFTFRFLQTNMKSLFLTGCPLQGG